MLTYSDSSDWPFRPNDGLSVRSCWEIDEEIFRFDQMILEDREDLHVDEYGCHKHRAVIME